MDRANEIRRKPGLRNLSGLSYAWDCAILHWTGYVLLSIGLLCLAIGEYLVRVPMGLGQYVPNAFLAMVGPFLALIWADWLSIRTYRQTSLELRSPETGSRLLDLQVIDGLRRDMQSHLVFRWLRPAPVRSTARHAAVVSRWWPALKLPEGTGLGRRLRELIVTLWMVLVPSVCALPVLGTAVAENAVPWQATGIPRQLFGWALLALVISLGYGGFALMRFAARRQAVLDYFALWKTESQAHS